MALWGARIEFSRGGAMGGMVRELDRSPAMVGYGSELE